MAMIHINRGGTTLGQFSEEDVRQGIRAGRFQPGDLGWKEGMPAWQPLSQWSDFAAEVAAAPPPPVTPPGGPSPAPAAAPLSPPVYGTTPFTESITPRSGLPWDRRQEKGWFSAFFETLQLLLTRPAEGFTAMKTEGGFVDPLIYGLIGGCAGAIVQFLLQFGLNSIGVMANRQSAVMLSWLGIGWIFLIILMPLILACILFIWSAILHVCLMIVGGAKKPYETTFRVAAYTQGATGPLQMVPLCGGLIAFVWSIVLQCIGLSKTHEIEIGRAVLAVFLPLILCCGGGIFLAFGIAAMSGQP